MRKRATSSKPDWHSRLCAWISTSISCILIVITVNNYPCLQECSTKFHPIILKQPLNKDAMAAMACWTHNRTEHDFFISYRVESEGKKCSYSIVVCGFFFFFRLHVLVFITYYAGASRRACWDSLYKIGSKKMLCWKSIVCVLGQEVSQFWTKLGRWIFAWYSTFKSDCVAHVR